MTNGVRHAVAVVGSPIRGHVWWPTKSDWINTIVREVYYNQPGRKVRASDMVDREATVERMGMLEVEDEVRRGRRGREGTRLITIAEHLTSSPFLAHTGGCAE